MASIRVAILGCSLLGATAADAFPYLTIVRDLAEHNPDKLIAEIRASPLCAVAPVVTVQDDVVVPSVATLPTVIAHGMGDTCWNPGMKTIGQQIAKQMGSYAVCVPTAGNSILDTIDGFLKDMDSSVDVFAAKIKADPKLSGGFNAMGFSQGNSLIRGYIHKYNDPPVNTWVSVHGTVQGVAAIPGCSYPQGNPPGLMCNLITEVLGEIAYNPISQHVLFQADYFRDPNQVGRYAYLKNSQIARWNNEDPSTSNATFKANFAKTKKFAMVKALKDSFVYPIEGEWWGAFEEGKGFPTVELTMKETKFYQQDLFGLKTADEAGKIFFETTPGDHLEFSRKDLTGWVQKYFIGTAAQTDHVIV